MDAKRHQPLRKCLTPVTSASEPHEKQSIHHHALHINSTTFKSSRLERPLYSLLSLQHQPQPQQPINVDEFTRLVRELAPRVARTKEAVCTAHAPGDNSALPPSPESGARAPCVRVGLLSSSSSPPPILSLAHSPTPGSVCVCVLRKGI